jgi:hypothetical protein
MTNTPTPPKQGVRARERNALERIASLEQDQQRLVGAVQQAFNESEKKLNDLSEIIEVLADAFGKDKIQEGIVKARTDRAEANAKQAKEQLDLALVEGKVAQIEKVEEGAIITGFEKDKDGTILVPGYVQLSLAVIKPEFSEKMMGQGVGFVFETEGGGQFEITGIYKAVPQPEATEQTISPTEAPPAPGSPVIDIPAA